MNEWADTMDKVLQLDFDTIIPGHGDPFTDKDRLRRYQSYLRDLWKLAGELKKQGLTAEDAAKKAKLFSFISIGLGLAVGVIYLLLTLLGIGLGALGSR